VAGARPEWLPEAAWDGENSTVKIDALAPVFAELNDKTAKLAVEESRKLTLPTDPSGYKIELPADFKAPEGVTFEFRADDPLLAQAQQLAHAKGIDQETFSQMLGLYAGAQVQDQSVITAAKTAEIGKLGVNGPARVDAVTTWLKSVGGADADILIKTLDYAPVAATVVAFENMMRKFAGGGGFTQTHREAPSTKPTDEEFNSWSYADQREYTSTGKRPQRAA